MAAARSRHQIILGVGGGIRERHTYAIAIDLGLPTGALAQLAGATCEQNAIMVYNLLARHGASGYRGRTTSSPSTWRRARRASWWTCRPTISGSTWPVGAGSPPTGLTAGPTCGTYLVAQVYSCRSCIFLKDVDGLYTADPRQDPGARFIPRISTSELLAMDLPDLPIERAVLEILHVARNRKEIRIVNGLVPGNLTRALEGEEVGTVIYQG